jgi:hypothetical protein
MQPPRPPVKTPALELDWVIVSVEGLRRWGLLVFFLLLAGGILGGAYYYLHEPIDKKAQRVLRQALAAQDEVKRAGVSESLEGEYQQASRLLEEARSDLDRKDYPACLARGEDALRRFELMGGLAARDFVGSGQVISLQGRVDVQRANQTKWERASEKQPLYNGDFVKTGDDASAEILFSDGTVFRVGPNSLLEVHREARTGREPSSGEVKVKVGQVNVFTATNSSSVLTESARAQVDRDSRLGVEVGQDSSALFATYSGKTTVVGSGGERVELSEKQAVNSSSAGHLSGRRPLPDAPLLEEPPGNALFNLDLTRNVALRWRPVSGCTAYDFQLSRSRRFNRAALEPPSSRRPTNKLEIKVMTQGTYYWRVRALSADGAASEWSATRAFKAMAGRGAEEIDATPPRLEVQRPQQMGNFFLIQGMTDSGGGVTVLINGEAVAVGGDGTFKKALVLNREGQNIITIRATNPAGKSTERTERVFVEVD